MSIGDNIKRIRKKKKLTQKELAKRAGLATGTIQQYEYGLYKPKSETITRIAEALEVPRYVLTGDKADLFIGKNAGAKTVQYFLNDMSDEVKNMDMGEADLILSYRKLNSTGKDKVRDFAEDLTKIPEYRQ